jgi:hypothetical protein
MFRYNLFHPKIHSAACRCKLNCISQQINQNLVDSQEITVKSSTGNLFCAYGQLHALLPGLGNQDGCQLVHEVGKLEPYVIERYFRLLNPAHIQHIIHQTQ